MEKIISYRNQNYRLITTKVYYLRQVKKLVFSLLSLFLTYQTYKLLSILLYVDLEMGLLLSFLFAILINLFATGVFAFIGFVFPTHRVICSRYYKIYNPNRLKQIYQVMNVELFRKYLLIAIWGKEENRKKFFNGSRSGIEDMIYMTKQSEVGHLLAFVVIFIICIFLLAQGYWALIVLTSIINVIFNTYPVLLQRYHRMRVSLLLARFKK